MTGPTPAQMPAMENQVESDRLKGCRLTREATVAGRERNPRGPDGASGTPFRKICQCGCSQSFAPRDHRQKFLPGHRFVAYEMHSCPSCGIKHRVSKKGQTK